MLSLPLTMTQMVGYYQDPEGKRIFARSDPSVMARDTNAADLQRKQTQELESGVSVIANIRRSNLLRTLASRWSKENLDVLRHNSLVSTGKPTGKIWSCATC